MGQKVHPGGLRVGVIHDWKSNWWTGKPEFSDYLLEDVRIRKRTCHVTLVLAELPEQPKPRRRRSRASEKPAEAPASEAKPKSRTRRTKKEAVA